MMFSCCCTQEDEAVAVILDQQPLISAAPAEPPPPPGVEKFDAVIERPTATAAFGWKLDTLTKDTLFVESLSTSPGAVVNRYNASAAPGRDIRVGDYITHVDGAVVSENHVGSENLKVMLSIQRIEPYTIDLEKGDAILGLELNYTATRSW